MNRRIRNPITHNVSKSKSKSDRYLKPGALARIRDSKIRKPANPVKIQILTPPASPVRSINTIDGSPIFAARIHGTRLYNRKKIVSSKRIYFASSAVEDPIDSGLDLVVVS